MTRSKRRLETTRVISSHDSDLVSWIRCPADVPLPDTPRLGGRYKCRAEDFQVEEIARFDPDGKPGHRWLWVEKLGISTPELIRRLARGFNCTPEDIGTAGLKDSVSLSRQWVSIPERVAGGLHTWNDAPIRILSSAQNSRKLRTGELDGNRFQIVVRDAETRTLPRRFSLILPNYFGAQRFGDSQDNHWHGRELLIGARREPRGARRRMWLSAAQSALFNAYVAARVRDGCWETIIPGDVAFNRSGRILRAAELSVDDSTHAQARAAGPMFGPRMQPAFEEALRREQDVLDAAGLEPSDFERFAKLTAGTRRAIVLPVEAIDLTLRSPDVVELAFSLPAGSYASVILRALGVDQD